MTSVFFLSAVKSPAAIFIWPSLRLPYITINLTRLIACQRKFLARFQTTTHEPRMARTWPPHSATFHDNRASYSYHIGAIALAFGLAIAKQLRADCTVKISNSRWGQPGSVGVVVARAVKDKFEAERFRSNGIRPEAGPEKTHYIIYE